MCFALKGPILQGASTSTYLVLSTPPGNVLPTVVLILYALYSPPVQDLQCPMPFWVEIIGFGVRASALVVRILSASSPHFVLFCFSYSLTSVNSYDFNYHLCVRILKLKSLS